MTHEEYRDRLENILERVSDCDPNMFTAHLNLFISDITDLIVGVVGGYGREEGIDIVDWWGYNQKTDEILEIIRRER